jgi:hypothetical protein
VCTSLAANSFSFLVLYGTCCTAVCMEPMQCSVLQAVCVWMFPALACYNGHSGILQTLKGCLTSVCSGMQAMPVPFHVLALGLSHDLPSIQRVAANVTGGTGEGLSLALEVTLACMPI